MSNFISGQDLLTRLDILPFELFNRVKNGFQPFNRFGEPVAPPDISAKIKKIKDLRKEADLLKPEFDWWFRKTFDERKAYLEKITNLDRAYLDQESAKSAKKKFDGKTQDIQELENGLARIENKYSWENYELPESDQSKDLVINLLLNSFYKLEEVASAQPKLKKEFILGADIRSRWNIDKKQFFNIISDAVDSKKGKWILRPHNPRNYKHLTFAEGHVWPPCREVGGKIIENYSPPEYESSLDKVIEYLDQYCYLLEDVETVERTIPALSINSEVESQPSQKENINEYLSKAGKKGGEKPKKNQPIIFAVIKYLEEHATLKDKSNYRIAESFKRHVGKNEPIIVNFNECEWDVYFADKYIWAIADATNKKKHKNKSIAYTTFMNSYISEAKKIIKKT